MNNDSAARWVVPWAEVRDAVRGRGTVVCHAPSAADHAPVDWSVVSLEELIGSATREGDVVIADLWEWPDPKHVLRAAHEAAASGRLVVVVPNIARPSLVRRLVLGLGDADLPPPAPGGWFTRERLDRYAAELGRLPVPTARPVPTETFLPGRPFDDLLAAAAADAGVHDREMLVRTYEPSTRRHAVLTPPPFLTVLLRTQGRRLDALADVILCLSAQTCADFEVLVLAHDVNPSERAALQSLLHEQPELFRSRLHLVDVLGGGRSRPLNVGLQNARGRYVAVLDDDDLVLADWVAVFRALSCQQPGRIVRALAAEQSVEVLSAPTRPSFRAAGLPQPRWEPAFSLVSHIVDNHSPVHSYAYPREVFTERGLTFDETLPVLEDWDLLVRAASVVGVSDAREITCIYRRWPAAESSFSHVPEADWPTTAWGVVQTWDQRPLLMPQGSATRLRRDGIWILQHRPLRDKVLGRLERWSDRWSMALLRTPLGTPLRRVYRRLKAGGTAT